jgi:transposase
LSRLGTIQDIADFLGVSWDLVKEIQKDYLEKYYSKPDIKDVELIAIDEFSVKKGHKYMTVVMDLVSGRVIYAAEGKDAACLDAFWQRVRRNKVKIKAVAMDMSPAYLSAVVNNIPEAKIVHDHFHIIKAFNDELTELRREIYRDEKDLNKRDLIKGTRWLLLKNSENLETDDEKQKLQEALNVNKPLAIAYYLKEDLGLLWEQDSKKEAEIFLNKWVKRAYASGLFRLQRFANSLLAHRSALLNWYDFQISTGPLEGLNNKIKVMKRDAYGYRDMEFFKLKIYSLHEKKYALTG